MNPVTPPTGPGPAGAAALAGADVRTHVDTQVGSDAVADAIDQAMNETMEAAGHAAVSPHPADTAPDGLAPWLAWLDAAIEREIARLRARYELSLDELRGLYISDAQVEALLARSAPEANGPAAPPPWPSRFTELARALALDDDDLALLGLMLASETDAKYEPLWGYLNNDAARRWPTPELALRLLGRDAAHRGRLRARLAPQAPLFAQGLAETVPGTREAARHQRGLRLPAALADRLLGLPWQDERLQGLVRPLGAADAARAVSDHGPSDTPLARLATRDDPFAPVLVCTATTALDATRAAERALAGSGRTWQVLDLTLLRSHAAPGEVAAALTLALAVQGAGLLVAPLEAAADPEGRPLDSLAAPLRRLAQQVRPLVLAGSAGWRWRELLGDVRALELPQTEPEPPARAQAWADAMARALQATPGVAAAPDAAALVAVADRFALGLDRIDQAARLALDLAQADGAPRVEAAHLAAAARAVSTEGGSDVVRTVPQRFGWDDLVVAPEVRERLRELVSAVELRPLVMDRWALARPGGGARGIKALFAGPSGTGKTMAAAIIARELGQDLHRVELSAVMSKYIGETEKNLDRAFAAARRANAVLFIDEADALLGKRSEVKDAHDRYANVEVAYLLQKMEDHEGVVIVATNLAQNIDPAFSRRMQFMVNFPLPEVPARLALWQAMLPPEAPRAADLDLPFLARQFAFSGGEIRNITLEAAFRAAQRARDEGGAGRIGMRELLAAVVSHYAKRGRLPHAGEFGQYAALLGPLPRASG